MKKVGFLLLITIFCFGLGKSAKAQNENLAQQDYLVNNNYDTAYGKYKKKVFGHAYFNTKGKKVFIDPQNFISYRSNNTVFRSIQLSNSTKPQWMECLETGEISLYQYIIVFRNNLGTTSSNVVWLAQKNGGPILNVNGIMASQAVAKSNLQKLLFDNQTLAADLNSYPFNSRTIQYLIHKYNLEAN